jgi:membrane associated rhomboid family serine protease
VFLPLKDENPTFGVPWVTGILIGGNVLAFVSPRIGGISADGLVSEFGLVPSRLFPAGAGLVPSSDWFTLFTSLFLHANLIHLGGNLLYLWIFGNNIEDTLGPFRFVVFYVLSGLGGHSAHLATNLGSPIPTIGASGAIAGVLAAYLLRYPRARVLSLIFLVFFVRLIRVPAAIVILFWLITQVLGGVSELGSPVRGGVAWFEHLGGFVAGLVFFPLLGGRRAARTGLG